MDKNEDFNENLEPNILEEEFSSNKKEPTEKPRWYVIHTYSGYENNVKANIEKIIENREMYDVITEVVVPVQITYDITKSGKKKEVQRKIFPGYVFLKMIMNDETWYVVRNTRGVTSFVGPGSKPVALTEDEVISMGIESFVKNDNADDLDDKHSSDDVEISSDTSHLLVGDLVFIKEGKEAKRKGVVEEINIKKGTVTVNIEFSGRQIPCEVNISAVQRMG